MYFNSFQVNVVFLHLSKTATSNNVGTMDFHPVNIYLIKVNNRISREKDEIYSKLTTKRPERHHCFYC